MTHPTPDLIAVLRQMVYELNAANSHEQLEGYFDGWGDYTIPDSDKTFNEILSANDLPILATLQQLEDE